MKKILSILAVLAILSAGVFAREKEDIEENLRVSLNLSDSISTNLLSAVNTTNVGLEISTYNNNVGFLAGAMVREMIVLSENSFPGPTAINWNPYIGIELWNVEALFGVIPITGSEDSSWSPYISLGYNWDIIPPTNGLSNSLSLKFGLDYFVDVYKGKDSEEELGNAFIAMFSILLPKAYVGVQYKLGRGWAF